jgi:hypothetical protein
VSSSSPQAASDPPATSAQAIAILHRRMLAP